jgi:hypothetical protein
MTAQLTHKKAQTTQPATPADRGPLRDAWHRICLTIQEMNYASRRIVELQESWSIDKQWHGKQG